MVDQSKTKDFTDILSSVSSGAHCGQFCGPNWCQKKENNDEKSECFVSTKQIISAFQNKDKDTIVVDTILEPFQAALAYPYGKNASKMVTTDFCCRAHDCCCRSPDRTSCNQDLIDCANKAIEDSEAAERDCGFFDSSCSFTRIATTATCTSEGGSGSVGSSSPGSPYFTRLITEYFDKNSDAKNYCCGSECQHPKGNIDAVSAWELTQWANENLTRLQTDQKVICCHDADIGTDDISDTNTRCFVSNNVCDTNIDTDLRGTKAPPKTIINKTDIETQVGANSWCQKVKS